MVASQVPCPWHPRAGPESQPGEKVDPAVGSGSSREEPAWVDGQRGLGAWWPPRLKLCSFWLFWTQFCLEPDAQGLGPEPPRKESGRK